MASDPLTSTLQGEDRQRPFQVAFETLFALVLFPLLRLFLLTYRCAPLTFLREDDGPHPGLDLFPCLGHRTRGAVEFVQNGRAIRADVGVTTVLSKPPGILLVFRHGTRSMPVRLLTRDS